MKKLMICLLLAMPFTVLAQDENPPLFKDFYTGTRGIPVSFVLNEHVNIMQVNIDNENFDVTAVNDQMQVLWKTTLKGHALATAKFNGKILAVASTEYSAMKRNNNTFKATIIDPSTGKVMVDKVIFDGSQDYMSFPFVYVGDGSTFKFAVRQSAFERRLHVALPSLLGIISTNSYTKQFNETKDLDVIDFNDKLEPVYKCKPVITAGTFIEMSGNKQGDLFIAWYNNGNMDIVKYDASKGTPSKTITGDIILDKDVLDSFGGNNFFLKASKANPNIVYYALAFRNPDKETELGIGKLDFSTGKKQYVNEIFTKDRVKGIKKSYVSVNKKMNSPDLGPVKALNIRSFGEADGHVVVSLTSTSYSSGMNGGTWDTEYNILLNCYDTDLNLKFQQLIPTMYTVPQRHLPIGYYYDKNKLYVLSNDKQGMTTIYATYSVIDLTTGKCDKMYWLSKKKISNSNCAASASVLWFADSFVVPYLDMRGFSGGKYDITLQQNNY